MITCCPRRSSDGTRKANVRHILSSSALGAALFTLICTSVGSPVAVAAEAKKAKEKNYGIEEITVTARRRAESIQETPISITAMTSSDLEMRNITNLTNIDRFTPNLTFERGSGNTGGNSNAQVFIRGVGQQDFLFTTEPGVGIYVDGVYFSRQMGNTLDLIDLERVEVLRGPQGTLFGKNTIGGAIQLISKKPTGKFGGWSELTMGSYHRVDVKGGINVPITPKLAAKLSVASLNRDGYVTRLIDGVKLGDVNADSARLQLKWKAADNLNVLLSGDYSRRREQSIPDVAVAFNDNAFFLNLWNTYAGLGTYSSAYATNNPYTTNATAKSKSDLDAWGLSGTVDWQLDNFAVKSITAYRTTDAAFSSDPDNSPLPYLETSNDTHVSQFSQEMQFSGDWMNSRLHWLGGLFYLHETGHDHFISRLGQGLYAGLGSLALDLDSIRNTSIKTDSYAAFTHASYDLTSKLGLSAGIRFTHEKKDFTASYFKTGAQLLVVPPTLTSASWSAWSPKVSLEYHLTQNLMTYVSASKGFKSGGFNGRPSSLDVATSIFNPETVWSYEAGIKSTWLDRRLLLNVAGFISKYNDIQLTAIIATPAGGLIAAVDNAGKADINGVEAELSARPVPNLDINASLGYIDAHYTELLPGVQVVTLDSKFVKTPKWTYNIGAQYTVPLGERVGDVTARVDWSYRSTTYMTPNNIPILAQPGYGLLSARLTYKSTDDTWEVAVFGNNLTDKAYITNGLEAINVTGTADATYARPREWGASIKANF